jgi:hypothetical protein
MAGAVFKMVGSSYYNGELLKKVLNGIFDALDYYSK